MAERAVGLEKSTLAHQLDGNRSLDFFQLEELFLRVSHILNLRPIGARAFTEEDFHPISPNGLLLGRAAKPREAWESKAPDQAIDPVQTLSAVEELSEKWWMEWS